LEDVEEKQQEKEEAVAFSSQMEDLIAEYGEDESEDWELVDAREVDYKLEENLDEQVKEWGEQMQPKKSLLSKLWEFVGTGSEPKRTQ